MTRKVSLKSVANFFEIGEDEFVSLIKKNHHVFSDKVTGIDFSGCKDDGRYFLNIKPNTQN
jgi:transposase